MTQLDEVLKTYRPPEFLPVPAGNQTEVFRRQGESLERSFYTTLKYEINPPVKSSVIKSENQISQPFDNNFHILKIFPYANITKHPHSVLPMPTMMIIK